MLVSPDVSEGESPHVRQSRHLRQLVLSVVSPDESRKHLHEINVFPF